MGWGGGGILSRGWGWGWGEWGGGFDVGVWDTHSWVRMMVGVLTELKSMESTSRSLVQVGFCRSWVERHVVQKAWLGFFPPAV